MQYVTLNDGNRMPQLGFGVFQILDQEQAKQAVSDAIQVGYRLFDTAAVYMNEAAVGKVIRESGIDRSEFFVTSKFWVDHFSYEKAKQGIDESLNKLGLDYIDLYLLHHNHMVTLLVLGEHSKKPNKQEKLNQLVFLISILIN